MSGKVNLSMYTRINTDGSITVEKPVSKAGDKIVPEPGKLDFQGL